MFTVSRGCLRLIVGLTLSFGVHGDFDSIGDATAINLIATLHTEIDRYDDIEFVSRSVERSAGNDREEAEQVVKFQVTRTLVDGERFATRLDTSAPGEADESQYQHQGYDGQTYWIAKDFGEIELFDVRPSSERWQRTYAQTPLNPHNLLVGISSLLNEREHDIEIGGTDDVEGLQCRILSLTDSDSRQFRIWLATSRNYIPAKFQEVFDGQVVRRGVASDWRTISPGQWFPFYCLVETYAGARSSKTESVIDDVTAEPQSRDFSPPIRFGAKVTSHRSDKVRRYVQGKSETIEPWSIWTKMLLINDCLIGFVLVRVAFLWCIRRTKSEKSNTRPSGHSVTSP